MLGQTIIKERCMTQSEWEIVYRLFPEVPRDSVVIELSNGSFLFAEHGVIYHLATVD